MYQCRLNNHHRSLCRAEQVHLAQRGLLSQVQYHPDQEVVTTPLEDLGLLCVQMAGSRNRIQDLLRVTTEKSLLTDIMRRLENKFGSLLL